MKRSLLSIFFLLIVTLAAVAQPRISSNKETHNFGQIEWKRPVTVEYTITNTGNQPLVLTNVTTSCACAVADWTKEQKEIKSGASTFHSHSEPIPSNGFPFSTNPTVPSSSTASVRPSLQAASAASSKPSPSPTT